MSLFVTAVALVVGLTSPSDAGIVSREEVTPWLTRYVVEGTSTDLPNDPNVIRISARDVVTLTITLIPSPLSPNGPASARFYGGCIYPHTVLPGLILRSASSRVSKDEWHQRGHMVRDGATRLLTMRD